MLEPSTVTASAANGDPTAPAPPIISPSCPVPVPGLSVAVLAVD